ncbi:MerR family transcriptional regulator [Nocardia brasiliensis]|uniref:MerR family transcriptional regulator n=2 Tax=Nocardia brasiliensis TaxID=37326 RepID=K0F016_NOCB7|nr:MerR family transcriptional regulator [Nocardia brasiliensis ATCC 700358]OCF86474.1 MerR family transcriptional regulator [Nocardia brasiliensis]
MVELEVDFMSNEQMHTAHGVSIGQAAALYCLAPSTLRWWEHQQVLPAPPRVNGHRVYTETELRRIGLAYLCCVVGAMPLDQAAVVTGGSRDQRWQRTVQQHAGVIAQKIEQLRSTHEYLLHLVQCPDDDIVGQCPDLDDELMRHTPRGRLATADFIAAAQSIPASATHTDCDESGLPRDENIERPHPCVVCAAPVTQADRGRRRKYCSRACRQRQYRRNAER